MVYLVRVESKRRVKGVTLAANIVVEAEGERIAELKALTKFACAFDQPTGNAIVKKVTLEVA